MLAWLTWLLKKREKKEPSSSKLIILSGIWNGLHCSFHVYGNPEYAFKISFESKSNVINVQRSSEIAARGEIMRQSLEGLSAAIERFINLLEVRGARPHRLHSRLCHHAHTRQHKNQLLATAWINRSVNSCLAPLFALQDENCECVCRWIPEWKCASKFFVKFLPKKSLKAAAVTHTQCMIYFPPNVTELKPFTQ